MSSTPFKRDRLTWLAYSMLAYIAFTQSMLGPIMPFLRSELELSYTRGGLLPAAIAIGLIFSGLTGDRLAQRWGRGAIFWSGAVGLAIGAVLLGAGRSFEMVFLASLTIGFGSSLTQVMIQALLADQHGERRAIAISEANVAASLLATLTPLFVGGLQWIGLGWRAMPLLPFLFIASLAALFRSQPIPEGVTRPSQSTPRENRLPFIFWMYWIVLLMVVAVEMTLAVWATDFLASVAGLSQANAALAFSSFPAAMLIGRYAGSRLARVWSSEILLLFTLGLTLLGFPLFWLSRLAILNILGLFITGLGIANLYPFTISIAIGLAGEKSNQASARASLGVGSALLAAPLFLGWLADRIGLQNAYGIGIVFIILAFILVVVNHGLVARRMAKAG